MNCGGGAGCTRERRGEGAAANIKLQILLAAWQSIEIMVSVTGAGVTSSHTRDPRVTPEVTAGSPPPVTQTECERGGGDLRDI
jgi:hypothetical protein